MKNNIELQEWYKIAIDSKRHTEQRRDNINSFYISLFSAIIAIIPFIPKFTDNTNLSIEFTSMFLSFLGFLLSLSWLLMLIRINKLLIGIEKFIIDIEKKEGMSFISHLSDYLNHTNPPIGITKQQSFIPLVFLSIFVLIFIYNY